MGPVARSFQQYRQCNLLRGSTHQTAWIPALFATEGRFLSIRGENGWLVTSTGPFFRNLDFLSIRERDYRKDFPSL